MKGKGFVRAIVCAVLCCCLVLGAAGCGGGSNANEIENLQKQIDDLKAQITLLQEANAALAQEVNGAKTKLNAVESKIAATETALATAERERKALKTDLTALQTSAETQKSEIENLKTELAALEKQHADDSAAAEAQRAKLREELQTAQTALQGLETKVTQLETALSEKDTEIAALQSELTALQSRVQALETELAEQKKLLSDLTAYTYGENGGKLYSIGDTVSYVANGVKFFDVTICGECHTKDGYELAFDLNSEILSSDIINKLLHGGGRFLEGYIYDKTKQSITIGQSGLIPSTHPAPDYAPDSNGYFIWNNSSFPEEGEKLFFLYAGNTLVGIFDHITFPEENTNT